MTDRMRFEQSAIEHGCAVNASEPCKLTITSVNGVLRTTYFFDAKGNFIQVFSEKI